MITDAATLSRLTQAFGFLAPAPKNDFSRRFAEAATAVRLEKGASVCQEGSVCSHLALVYEGTARVYKLGENGREITLYRIGPGESCILTASCILSSSPFPAFAECETMVRAAVVPAIEVQRWLAESAPWRDYVFGLLARRLADIISVVEEVAFHRMDRRIAGYLTEQSARDGLTLHATHQEIASELGTSREVVSRILKDFEHRQLIRVSRGSIAITAPDALAEKSE
jgi:CRP/FNR family transcriptional regulator